MRHYREHVILTQDSRINDAWPVDEIDGIRVLDGIDSSSDCVILRKEDMGGQQVWRDVDGACCMTAAIYLIDLWSGDFDAETEITIPGINGDIKVTADTAIIDGREYAPGEIVSVEFGESIPASYIVEYEARQAGLHDRPIVKKFTAQ